MNLKMEFEAKQAKNAFRNKHAAIALIRICPTSDFPEIRHRGALELESNRDRGDGPKPLSSLVPSAKASRLRISSPGPKHPQLMSLGAGGPTTA